MEEEKERLRDRFRAVLDALGTEALSRHSAQIVVHLAAWLPRAGPRTVAMFAALRAEVNLAGLHGVAPTIRFLYPRVDGSTLQFHEIADPGTLVPGRYGLREPDPAIHSVVALEDIEAFLCPGLAFAPDGVRLGRGGGFYDRVLAAARQDAPRIGIGVDAQSAEELPHAAHDILMTHRASESGVWAVDKR